MPNALLIVTHLPVIDSRLFCHQLVYTKAALPTISEERYVDETRGTHVPHHVPVDADQLGEFAVSLVYLACSTPKASGHTHGGENTIVIEQQALECFLDKDQVL